MLDKCKNVHFYQSAISKDHFFTILKIDNQIFQP